MCWFDVHVSALVLRTAVRLGLPALLLAASAVRAEEKPAEIQITVDLGPDRGQNFGSLLEIRDHEGRVLAGAGFLGAYNTQPRSERQQLHVYVTPRAPANAWQVDRLPEVPGNARGYYCFVLEGQLYVLSRGGSDGRVWRWDAQHQVWQQADDILPYMELVAGRRLAVTTSKILYDGRTLLDWSDRSQRIGNHYFARGQLILREVISGDGAVNRLVVYPWDPLTDTELQENSALRFDLPMANEFVYAFGQWHDDVIVATNYGTVLRLNDAGWSVLREAVPGVSYQIYAALNYEDRLLLGHYPTGEIFSYTGGDLRLLDDWPPRIEAVSPHAREAQTLTIYGGELHAGVWPWGEVWRYDRGGENWDFVQRMFSHPEPTDDEVHPYEAETKAVDAVINLWGQRVTGMAPVGSSLFITTSSKTGQPWDEKFDFLSPDQLAEYGAVYRATRPKNLAATIRWPDGPTQFTFRLLADGLEIVQDEQRLAHLPLAADQIAPLRSGQVTFASGVFGPLRGSLLRHSGSFNRSR